MEPILEQQRRKHEERERIMDAMVRRSLRTPATNRQQINNEHKLKASLDRYFDCTSTLAELYEDRDSLRRDEIESISGPNEFSAFYQRLKSLKEFHRTHPDEIKTPMSLEFAEINQSTEEGATEKFDDETMIDFTDEESYGKYLDLHECYQKYINLKGIQKIDYITYLTTFDRLFEIPRERKNTQYKKYLDSLLEYLHDFLTRTKPLLDLHEESEAAVKNFDEKFENGNFPGWGKQPQASGALTHAGAYLDLSSYNSAEELIPLGLDRLKSALIALGLKCGGSVEERAHRLFQSKGKPLDELDPSLFAIKKRAGPGADTVTTEAKKKNRDVALLEAYIYHYVELVSETRAATKDNVERRQARGAEREDEELELEVGGGEEEEHSDEDEAPYNPKNLPLGWDGKPIPYWLYKLHGLNISYPCEICGNQVYKGPKAFQRHFSEWRHAHGMRCLSIPNTAHFANITKIADAMRLWEKLKYEKDRERFKPEFEEEFEDLTGNVVNRRIYEDLKRQGLV